MNQSQPYNIDKLSEFINIGVGHAAGILNDLIGKRIKLSVPSVHVYPRENINDALSSLGSGYYSTVTQNFAGDFSGSASLLFPSSSSKRFVDLVAYSLGSNTSNDAIRISTLKEIGNILINSVMGTITNMTSSHIRLALPDFYESQINDLIQKFGTRQSIEVIVIAESVFSITGEMIKGAFLILLEISAMAALGLELSIDADQE